MSLIALCTKINSKKPIPTDGMTPAKYQALDEAFQNDPVPSITALNELSSELAVPVSSIKTIMAVKRKNYKLSISQEQRNDLSIAFDQNRIASRSELEDLAKTVGISYCDAAMVSMQLIHELFGMKYSSTFGLHGMLMVKKALEDDPLPSRSVKLEIAKKLGLVYKQVENHFYRMGRSFLNGQSKHRIESRQIAELNRSLEPPRKSLLCPERGERISAAKYLASHPGVAEGLEAAFRQDPAPNDAALVNLSSDLGAPLSVIREWMGNKRYYLKILLSPEKREDLLKAFDRNPFPSSRKELEELAESIGILYCQVVVFYLRKYNDLTGARYSSVFGFEGMVLVVKALVENRKPSRGVIIDIAKKLNFSYSRVSTHMRSLRNRGRAAGSDDSKALLERDLRDLADRFSMPIAKVCLVMKIGNLKSKCFSAQVKLYCHGRQTSSPRCGRPLTSLLKNVDITQKLDVAFYRDPLPTKAKLAEE